MSKFNQYINEAISGEDYEVATKVMSVLLGVESSSPFYAYYMKYQKKNGKHIAKYYEEYGCETENMFGDPDLIHVLFIQPILEFWKKAYFKRRLIFFSQKTGSRKLNSLFYKAVNRFIKDNAVDTNAFKVESSRLKKFTDLLSARAEKLKASDDDDVAKFFNAVCPVSEKIERLIDLELVIESHNINDLDPEYMMLDEANSVGGFLKKRLNRIGNWLKRKIGNNSLAQVVYRVSDRLGLSNAVIEKIVSGMQFQKGLGSSRTDVKEGRSVNAKKMATIITRGVAEQLYNNTGTVEKMDDIFQNNAATRLANMYVSAMFNNDNFLNVVYKGIYTDVTEAVKEIENKNNKSTNSSIGKKR